MPSTATRSHIGRSTPCRGRSVGTTAGLPTRWSGSCRCCCASGRRSARAPSSSAGTRSSSPTYRNGLLATYQSGREFDPEILDQLELLPPLVSSTGIVCGKAPGSRPTTSSRPPWLPSAPAAATTLVATSDRDAFQLAAPDVTILQPVRGVSELQRIGPAEVRERYGVEPHQVPDFIALRGDPSDKIPGARGVGEKTSRVAPPVVPRPGGDDRGGPVRGGGRPAPHVPPHRDPRPAAPLPDLPDLEPDWAAGARAADELGVRTPRRAAAGGLTIEPVSHPAMAHLHPTGHHHHPEREERLQCLLEALKPELEGGRASREAIERAHDPEYVARIAALHEECWLDDDTIGQPTTWEAARLAAGCAIRAVELGGFALVRPRGTTRSPTARWASASSAMPSIAARHAQAELGVERVAIVDWDVHHGNGTEAIVRGDDVDPVRLAAPVAVLPRHGRPGHERRRRSSTFRCRRVRRRASTCGAFARSSSPRWRRSSPSSLIVSAGFDAHVDDPLAGMRVTADGFREMAARCTQLAPQVAAVLEGGYNLDTLPAPRRSGARGLLVVAPTRTVRNGRGAARPSHAVSPASS